MGFLTGAKIVFFMGGGAKLKNGEAPSETCEQGPPYLETVKGFDLNWRFSALKI